MTLICTSLTGCEPCRRKFICLWRKLLVDAWRAVESAVRRTAKLAWKTDPEKVQVLAGYQLDHRPTAGQFLEMMYDAADTMYEKK